MTSPSDRRRPRRQASPPPGPDPDDPLGGVINDPDALRHITAIGHFQLPPPLPPLPHYDPLPILQHAQPAMPLLPAAPLLPIQAALPQIPVIPHQLITAIPPAPATSTHRHHRSAIVAPPLPPNIPPLLQPAPQIPPAPIPAWPIVFGLKILYIPKFC
ncbi:hypothetical protein FRC02_012074 [Tulasnella sp. 418]|nr:hypothetical protein FRC02_012074 [Tulasnella sp. 418]